MHELSLARGLLDQVRALVREHDAKRALRVRLAIGPLAGVVTDSFRFGFEVLGAGDPVTSRAALEIEAPAPSYRCWQCRELHQSGDGERPERCRVCGGTVFFPEGGDEIMLLQVEME